jgi:hypothetical protein
MNFLKSRRFSFPTFFILAALAFAGCGAPSQSVNVNTSAVNTNTNTNSGVVSNANVSVNANSAASAPTVSVEAKEPDQYQATVTIKLEAVGADRTTTLPTLSAKVARSGNDRRMEFAVPAGGRVIYLDKAGTNYLIMPDKRQYAELNKESLGFDMRRMLMPEQIVQQVQNTKGVERVGDEQYNGRDATRYRYGAVTNTQTKAGSVSTESFLIVDKATGLPLRSETVSQSQGGQIQGYSGLKMVTEITDIATDVQPAAFEQPTGLQKIEAEQVRAQVDLIFNSLAAFITQIMKQSQQPAPAAPAATPAG